MRTAVKYAEQDYVIWNGELWLVVGKVNPHEQTYAHVLYAQPHYLLTNTKEVTEWVAEDELKLPLRCAECARPCLGNDFLCAQCRG